ncbi:MAG TPA: hypothetical protein VGN72_18770 [Tepidisphaeraceae bacterium]|jgi:hypothetical protein|nr:hypothetical protein [Tepidisphaeraceae bacterium]
MHYEAIRDKLKQQPFDPFDIVLSSGDRYRVRHPDNVLITKRSLVVAVSSPKQRSDIPESYASVSYLHVASLEPALDKKSSKRSNNN